MSKTNVIGLGKKSVIGMVHCLPLPGSLGFRDNMEDIKSQAIHDAMTLEQAGCDAIIVENMGDGPFQALLDSEQAAALAVIATLVKEKIHIPMGIDAAFNDYKTSLSIAKAVGAAFIRIPVFVDTVIFYNGILYPCAREAQLLRKRLHAEDVLILGDIQVKHTFMLNPAITIEESAKMAVACGADAIIVTGAAIGKETPIDIIERVKKTVSIPVLAGSGVKAANIRQQLAVADGAIIGSSLKKDGIIANPVSLELTQQVIQALRKEDIQR